MTKKRFLSFILSALLVMTAFVPLGAYAAEKTREYAYFPTTWGDANNTITTYEIDKSPLYGGTYEENMGGWNYYRVQNDYTGSWKSLKNKIFNPITDLSEGDVVKFSFSVGAESYYPWNGLFWIPFEGTIANADGNGESTLDYKNNYVKISLGNGDLKVCKDGSDENVEKKLPAVTNKWNVYEILLTVGGANSNNKLAVYKDGVKWYENNDYVSGYGAVKTITDVDFMMTGGRQGYPFYIGDVQLQHYPAAVSERGLEVVINTGAGASDNGYAIAATSANIVVENYGNEEKSVALIVASYNDDGSLSEVNIDASSVAPKVERTLEVALKDSIEGKTVKHFLWSDLTGLNPLSVDGSKIN